MQFWRWSIFWEHQNAYTGDNAAEYITEAMQQIYRTHKYHTYDDKPNKPYANGKVENGIGLNKTLARTMLITWLNKKPLVHGCQICNVHCKQNQLVSPYFHPETFFSCACAPEKILVCLSGLELLITRACCAARSCCSHKKLNTGLMTCCWGLKNMLLWGRKTYYHEVSRHTTMSPEDMLLWGLKRNKWPLPCTVRAS
jgi:hypothetical protein